jgi:hypothetical protein
MIIILYKTQLSTKRMGRIIAFIGNGALNEKPGRADRFVL